MKSYRKGAPRGRATSPTRAYSVQANPTVFSRVALPADIQADFDRQARIGATKLAEKLGSMIDRLMYGGKAEADAVERIAEAFRRTR